MNAPAETPAEIVMRFAGAGRATPMRGLSEPEIAAVERNAGALLPEDIKALLRLAAGVEVPSSGTVRFDGGSGSVDLAGAFTRSLALLGDGAGNFWIVDINPADGAWGAVLFVCHDPPVLAVQAPDLSAFLLQVLAPAETTPPNALAYVQRDALRTIWKRDPWLISAPDARTSRDPLVSNFAAQLPEAFYVADLRSREVGSGFSWGTAGPNANVRRAGVDLLFAVEGKSPGLLKRMLRMKS